MESSTARVLWLRDILRLDSMEREKRDIALLDAARSLLRRTLTLVLFCRTAWYNEVNCVW